MQPPGWSLHPGATGGQLGSFQTTPAPWPVPTQTQARTGCPRAPGGCGSSQDCEPLDPPPSLTGPSAVGPAASVLHQLCPGLLGQTHLRGETPPPAAPAGTVSRREWGPRSILTPSRVGVSSPRDITEEATRAQRGSVRWPAGAEPGADALTPQLPGGQKENYDSDLDRGSPIRLSGRRLHGPAV